MSIYTTKALNGGSGFHQPELIGSNPMGNVRHLSAADLDADGDLDLVETACGGKARIYRNDSTAGGSAVSSGVVQVSYLGGVVLPE